MRLDKLGAAAGAKGEKAERRKKQLPVVAAAEPAVIPAMGVKEVTGNQVGEMVEEVQAAAGRGVRALAPPEAAAAE
jgi:hypothetical protein